MPSNYYLQIENTPSTLIRMVDSIRPELYDTSLEGDRFTLKEVVAHLADLEQTWLDRITTAIEFPGKAVEPFNEEARYNYEMVKKKLEEQKKQEQQQKDDQNQKDQEQKDNKDKQDNKDDKYSEKDIHHELEVFDNRRRDTVDYLLRLADDDWANTITHPEKGEMTVLEIVQYITGHDLYHVHQVSQYLK